MGLLTVNGKLLMVNGQPVNDPASVNRQQKEVTLTENGTTKIVPDSGNLLSGVEVTVAVPTSSGTSAYDEAVAGGYTGSEEDFRKALAVIPTAAKQKEWDAKAAGTHASQHGSSGSDPITPAAIGAAPSSHVSNTTLHLTAAERSAWNAKAAKPTVTTVTLSATGWNSSTKKQTVTVPGVLADVSKQIIWITQTTEDAIDAYFAAGIIPVAQAANQITLRAETVPTSAITINVVVQEVG